jgi:pimeloyl-ACP methyl ester carboxylesterase
MPVKIVGFILAVFALLYVGLVLLVYVFQRHLIYYPSKFAESELLKEAPGSGLEPWRNRKGELIGWVARNSQPADARLIVLHGNANHAHWCDYYAKAFQDAGQAKRWDVYLLEYPGYASRPGSPSEESLVQALVEAIDEFEAQDHTRSINLPKTFLLGESIGCGVAAQAVAQRPGTIEGMFFIAPFNNLSDLGASVMPILPVRLMLKDRYASDEVLKNYHGPIAFLTAGRDEVIPNRFTQKLFESYPGPKKLWTQPGASHNTFTFEPGQNFWKEMEEFLIQNSELRTQNSERGGQKPQ